MTGTIQAQISPPPEVEEYLRIVESGKRPVCKEQTQFATLIRKAFAAGDIYTDAELLERYLSLEKYFPFTLFPWERCLLALWLCTFYVETGIPRWPELFALVARGAGKNGFLSFAAFCLVSKYNPVPFYNVDITAMSEQQAARSFNDVWEVCENPTNTRTLSRFFKWTKSEITGQQNRGSIKFYTSAPKTKDGLRPGLVACDEVHGYQNYDLIEVFTTALGKTAQPRRIFITTNGYVRGGPLDDKRARARKVLTEQEDDGGMLPFLTCCHDKALAGDEREWYKANPSLEYLPDLLAEYKLEYAEYKANPRPGSSFVVKRLNCDDEKTESAVTSWENIVRASRPLPDLSGYAAIAAIDYARLRDMAAAGFWLRDGANRYWVSHQWVCAQSPDLPRIKAPWRDWAEMGLLTVVDAPEIAPEYLTEWLYRVGRDFDVKACAMDGFRYALMRDALSQIGFAEDKTGRNKVRFVSRASLMKAATVIDSCFTNGTIAWGADNHLMQWNTNNVSAKLDDKGNINYGKQEPLSRKTDGFFAMVAGATLDDLLPPTRRPALKRRGLITF